MTDPRIRSLDTILGILPQARELHELTEDTMDVRTPPMERAEAEQVREGNDAKALADRAITMATLYGKPSQTQHAVSFSGREKTQAISLLIEAARMIEARAYSLTDDTLRLLDLYRRADCDDHERLAEIGEALAELWSHMAEHERELEGGE